MLKEGIAYAHIKKDEPIPNFGDITKIDWTTVPDFDLLVGGSPCQSFSIAGKRTGLEGKSGLFVEYVRCLQEKKPEHFIWENVKGVFSSGHGADFAYVLNSFSEAGYDVEWHLLNAKDFGVPQNRERVFVIGTRADRGRAGEILPLREDDGLRAGPAENQEEVHDVASTLTARQYASWGGQPCKSNER